MHQINQAKNDDLMLINAVQNGDKAAFNSLVTKYQSRILKLINRYVKDLDESLDIGQEIFIKAYNSIDRFRKESSFFTWLYKIAINTTKSYLIDKNRHLPNFSFDVMMSQNLIINKEVFKEHNTPDNLLLLNELENVFIDVTNKLPIELKRTIQLREVHEYTYEEIAFIMECPVGTVRSRIFRAREAIEKNIPKKQSLH